MSASAINAAPPPSTGPAAGIGAGAGAAQAEGPLAGFEALLAAVFGDQLQPGATAAAGKAGKTTAAEGGVPTDADADASAKGAAGDAAVAQTPEELKAAEAAAAAAAALAACNAGLGVPVASLPIAATPTGDAATGEAATKPPAVVAGQAFAKAAEAALLKDEPPAGAAEAKRDIAAAAFDPNAPAPPTTGKLAPSIATPPAPVEPTRAATAQPPVAAPAAPASAAPISADPAPAVTPDTLAAPQAAAAAAAGVKVTEQPTPTTPVAAKDKAQGAKGASRNEPTGVDPTPATLKAGAAVVAAAADGAPKGGADEHPAQAAPGDAKTEAAAPAGSADAGSATASTTNALTQVHPGAVPVRGSPQTVANLAAQIAKKLEGRSTRFDLELNPQGLGRVDVRMEIGASGRMSAAMTFDTPQAAAELRARAAELQRHLEQAGFDLSGGLSFDVAGDRGQGRQAQQQTDNDNGQAFRGRAFQQALATAGEAAQSAASGALNLRRSLLSGVDIRI